MNAQLLGELSKRLASGPRQVGSLAVLALVLVFGSRAVAQGPAAIEPDTVRKVKKATAYVKVQLANGQFAEGSGFFAMEPGIVLTNAHVVGMLRTSNAKPKKVEVVIHSGQKDEFKLPATLLGVDRVHDLAVLRVQGEEARWPKPLAVENDLSQLVETQKVYVFGFPLGAQLGKEITVSESSIASLRNGSDGSLTQIQVNGGMHPGNSGGPVVDARGMVVGVAVAAIRGTAINFAVPSEKVHSAVHGGVQDTQLGERYRDNKAIKLPVQTAFLDPLARIKEVKLEYWTGPAGADRPATLKAPTPVAGDANRQAVAVDYKQSIAKHDLVLPTLPAGKVYWLQTVFVNKDGVKHWGPATSFRPSDGAPLDRVPANLTVKAETQLRSMNLTTRHEFQLAKGKEKRIQASVMEMQVLEALEKNARGTNVKLVLGKGGFYDIDQGRKVSRLASAQNSARGTVYDFQADAGGRLTNFVFVNFTSKDQRHMVEANDMAASVTISYMAASLGMPNRQLAAQETWEERIRMLLGPGQQKEVIDLVLTCTYEGSRTTNGKVEALIRMTGRIDLIKSPRPTQSQPIDTLSGSAVFNVTDGMVSKLKLATRAEFEADGLVLTDIFEIDYTRVPGNIYDLRPPTGGVSLAGGKVILQKNESLTADDPMNPKRAGTRQKAYEVNLTAGKTYVIEMNQPPGTQLDPYLRLEDNNGKVLADDDDSGGGLNARIIYKATDTAAHRLFATAFAPNQLGAFNLVVTEVVETKAAEGKFVLQKNESLAANDPMNPRRPGTRQKVYEVKLTAGKTYAIEMNQPPGTQLDPYLRLEDNTGQVLAEDDDGGGGPNGLNARIVHKAGETAVYRIVVTSFAANQLGEFNLVVAEVSDSKAK